VGSPVEAKSKFNKHHNVLVENIKQKFEGQNKSVCDLADHFEKQNLNAAAEEENKDMDNEANPFNMVPRD